MPAYADILRGRGWARPMAGSLIGRLPESMIAVALVLLVHESTGSYVSSGLVTGGFGLGSALAGPVAGRALDRLGQRPVLLVLALTFAAALVLLVVSAGDLPVPVTMALATFAGLTRPPLEAAMRALWTRIVQAGQLQSAYVLDAIGQDFIWLAGPLLLSLLLLVGEASSVLLACAAFTVLGTLTYSTTPELPRRRADDHVCRPRKRLRSTELIALLVAAALYGVSMGAFEIALIAFCTEHEAKAAVGILLAVWTVGSIIGAVIYGTRAWGTGPAQRTIGLLAAIAPLLALLSLATDVTAMALLLLAAGLPFAAFTGTLSAAVQAVAPPERATEGFAWITAMITSGIAAGNAAAGPLAESDVQLGFLFSAASAATGAALGLTGLRRQETVRAGSIGT